MTGDAWAEVRDQLREARERCFASIASALGVDVDRLPVSLKRAVVVFGHETAQATLQYAHDRDTLPAPRQTPEPDLPAPAGSTSVGAYRSSPTRVDTLRPRKKAR